METMTGLDLDQHQRSMDVLLHCQQLVRHVLWCNKSLVYVRKTCIEAYSYLINLSKARSNVPYGKKRARERGYIMMMMMMMIMFYSFYWYFPRYFSSFFCIALISSFSSSSSLSVFLSCLRTRLSNSSSNYFVLGRVPD